MKKIIVLIMTLLPLGLAAQEMKIAIVDAQAIFNIMPEVSEMENELVTMTQTLERELKSMDDEYARKMNDLTEAGDTLAENIRMLRLQEAQGIRERAERFYQTSIEARNKKQQELMVPIEEKLQKAIKEVGDENGYTYIISPQALLYKSDNAIDATEKVKAKMGLK
jgi:outer membrane protein